MPIYQTNIYNFDTLVLYQIVITNMVPWVGIEPTRYHYPRILSPVRLPVSPPGQGHVGLPYKIRTCDPLIKSQVLYRLS